MRLNAVKILKISITTNSKKEILEHIQKYLEKRAKFKDQKSKVETKPLIIFTPNPEQIVYAQKDKRFAQLLNQADITLPDGIGVVWAMHFLGVWPLVSAGNHKFVRIPGVELMEDLISLAAKESVNIGLIGGRGNLSVTTLECLQTKYSRINGWAINGPEVRVANRQLHLENADNYFTDLIRQIEQNQTQMLFVGLGAPKQEYFIESLKAQIINFKYAKPLVVMAVGGAFNIISGRLGRAPRALRHLGLEWCWRLLREPWRLSRQLALAKFIWLVVGEKLLYNKSHGVPA